MLHDPKTHLLAKDGAFLLKRRDGNFFLDPLQKKGWLWLGEFDQEATLKDEAIKQAIERYRRGDCCRVCGWTQGAHVCVSGQQSQAEIDQP